MARRFGLGFGVELGVGVDVEVGISGGLGKGGGEGSSFGSGSGYYPFCSQIVALNVARLSSPQERDRINPTAPW